MTRIIKASEIKPGMTIRWGESDGNMYQIKVDDVAPSINPDFVILDATDGSQIRLGGIPQITVLSEPASVHPEEPTEFGARVVVNGRRFLRAPEEEGDRWPWLEEIEGIWYDWDYLINVGPVTVVPDQGWTVPDTPEVPDRIEEWPEDDRALRKHKWWDAVGDVWVPVDDRWGWGDSPWRSHDRPVCGPWTRVTDA